ncbi:hypothetical protein [uncultured Desulfobulbus sp.]|uniref:hypothetical protein n=1 Tax=uncultured Desulfobulbus sp. TaxID=239745 RepID=UPI0029C8DF6C|nr:hypothetical protein [uncultured Desulfobulbus sp.]
MSGNSRSHTFLKWILPLILTIILIAIVKPFGGWAINFVFAAMIIYYEVIIIKRRFAAPAILLFFLAPVFGELISSSSPPLEFFSIFGVIIQPLLYGLGAIIVRELTFRWNKGWPTILLLGAAYGIVEEGLACKSFFNANWGDVGNLGVYGRTLGVNWVWSTQLTIYHMLFSIFMPILLTYLIFPAQKSVQWIPSRAFKWVCGVFAANVILMFCIMMPPHIYYPPIPHIIITLIVVFLFGLLARRIPAPKPASSDDRLKVRGPLSFCLIGAGATLSYALSSFIVPEIGLPPILAILILTTWAYAACLLIVRMSAQGRWTDKHKFSLAAGVLLVFVFIDLVREFKPGQADNPSGMAVVGIAILVFLYIIRNQIIAKNISNLHTEDTIIMPHEG